MNPKLDEIPAAASPTFTPLQGQSAFVYAYTCIFRLPPAEADMQRHFRVTPPSVHQMAITLERLGFITRQPAGSTKHHAPAATRRSTHLALSQTVRISVQRY